MPDRRTLRGVIVAEDKRTERFCRHLLEELGYDKRNFDFKTAPSGRGAADAWVLGQYPTEVKWLRSKRHQRLALVALTDGDRFGVVHRKNAFDAALGSAGLDARDAAERIANGVPTWAIENWLFCLLAHPAINENRHRPREAAETNDVTWRTHFERTYEGDAEKQALIAAARLWLSATPALPSLADGRAELARIDQ